MVFDWNIVCDHSTGEVMQHPVCTSMSSPSMHCCPRDCPQRSQAVGSWRVNQVVEHCGLLQVAPDRLTKGEGLGIPVLRHAHRGGVHHQICLLNERSKYRTGVKTWSEWSVVVVKICNEPIEDLRTATNHRDGGQSPGAAGLQQTARAEPPQPRMTPWRLFQLDSSPKGVRKPSTSVLVPCQPPESIGIRVLTAPSRFCEGDLALGTAWRHLVCAEWSR